MPLEYLQSDLLKDIPHIRHGFFTRQGGVSTGLYESLNVGRGSQDESAPVKENRRRIAEVLCVPQVETVYQIHSARVVDVVSASLLAAAADNRAPSPLPRSGGGSGRGSIGRSQTKLAAASQSVSFKQEEGGAFASSKPGTDPHSHAYPLLNPPPERGRTWTVAIGDCRAEQADGLTTTETHLGLGILTADCVPVLLAARDGSRVAAVHAGWKGAVQNIAAQAAQYFEGKEIVAAIGPAIAQQSYEVGQDVFDAASAPGFFRENGTPGKYQFDLQGFVAETLHQAGIKDIDILREDTYSQPTRFFSYRRATHAGEPDYGRQMSVIAKL